MTTNPTQPRLSDDAREKFRTALLHSADLLLEEPMAAAILADFLAGRAVLVLTRDGMAVRAVPPDWAETAEYQDQDSADATRDVGPSTGNYL